MRQKLLVSCIIATCALAFVVPKTANADDAMVLRGSSANTNAELENSEVEYHEEVATDINFADIEREVSWFSRSKTSSTIKNNALLDYNSPVSVNINNDNSAEYNIGEFVDVSLRNSDLLRGSLHEANAAGEATNAAKFALFPTISFEARQARSAEYSTLGTSLIETTSQTNSISGDWNLFSFGAGSASLRAADFAALSADMQYLSNERRVVVEAVGVYLQLLAGQKMKASLLATISRMNKILRATKARYRAGFASRTDVAQVENEIADVELQMSQATANLNESQIKWNALTGSKSTKKLSVPNIDQLLPATKSKTIQKALLSNPVIKGAQYSAQAAQEQTKVASAKFLPSVSVYGNIDLGDSIAYAPQENEWSVGAVLKVPLVNLAATSQYRQAQETAHASKYRARDQKRKVKNEIETSWVKLSSFKRRSAILRKKINAQARILKGVGKQVSAGLRPISDQLREETKYAQSKIDLIQNDLSKTAATFQIAIHFDDFTLDSIR